MNMAETTSHLDACEAVLDLLEPWIRNAEPFYSILTDANQEIIRAFRKARPVAEKAVSNDDPPPPMQKYCNEEALKRLNRETHKTIGAGTQTPTPASQQRPETNRTIEAENVIPANLNTVSTIVSRPLHSRSLDILDFKANTAGPVDFAALEKEAEKLLENI